MTRRPADIDVVMKYVAKIDPNDQSQEAKNLREAAEAVEAAEALPADEQ